MKRCPECRRDYYDDTLSFCLSDGAPLVYGLAEDEPATAILSEPPASAGGFLAGDAPTKPQIHTTDKTAIFPRRSEAEPRESFGGFSERRSFSAHQAAKPQENSGRTFDKRLLAAPFLLAIVAVGGFFGYRYFQSADTRQINSIAVLPFENNSGNADSEYLSDGIAESLIYRLSQIPELKVSPRSSVFRYKGKDNDAEKIGSELGVDVIMSGRLVQRGDNLTISVDLVDVRNRKTLWGEQFERKTSDLLSTQREIASAITEKLQLKLTGSQTAGITKKYTDNNEAYQLYMKGRFYWNKRTEADINRSIEYFDGAIALDPGFALAYSGLADAYQVLPNYQTYPNADETYPRARSVAQKAMELDPTLAEPHAALGVVLHEYEWKFPEAEKEFKRAIELNPNYASAHQWYGEYLANMGRHDESISEMKRALELDPLSLIINTALGGMYYAARRYDESIEQYKKTFEIDPDFLKAHTQLMFTYRIKGMFEESIEESRKRRLLQGHPPEQVEARIGTLRAAYRTSGPRGFWEKIMEFEREGARQSGNEPSLISLATCHVGLGDKDAALTNLEKAVASGRRDISLVQLNAEAFWDPIRGDPRFKELIRKIGLPK